MHTFVQNVRNSVSYILSPVEIIKTLSPVEVIKNCISSSLEKLKVISEKLSQVLMLTGNGNQG